MISKIKENNTMYIRRCNHCKSMFSYDAQDYVSNYGYGNAYGLIRCPYCECKNEIKFKIRYKSSKKVNQDYKAELDKEKNSNEELRGVIKRLEHENNELKNDASSYKKISTLYEREKRECERYKNQYNNEHFKVCNVYDYINDYMNSSKKSNLAIKYLKEIQEIIK